MDRRKKNRGAAYSFLKITTFITLAFLLALSAAVLAYNLTKPKKENPPAASEYIGETETPEPDGGGVVSDFFGAPERTPFLIAGIDENLLTDVLLAGCFNSVTKKFDFVSIPRDTLTAFSDEDVNILSEAGRRVPDGGEVKINSVYAYAGKDYGVIYLKKQIEELLGVEFDFYALVELSGFRGMVDAIGGVYMEIRPQGLYYSDPTQDLVIAVPGGMQLLDGAAAEGVIRYREDYARADIDRIDVQHEFMREFFKQALGGDRFLQNAFGLAASLLSCTRTDFRLRDAVKYARYAGDLAAENIAFYTLPGEEVREKESYYKHDAEKTAELVASIFIPEEAETEADETTDGADAVETEAPAIPDIKKMKIQILNGGDGEDTAKVRAERLKIYGYNVINVGEYAGIKQIRTRIRVKKDGDYDILAGYFKTPVIEVDPDIPDVYDIVIITGLSE